VLKKSSESSAYAVLGASSAKAGVLEAVGHGSFSRYFAEPVADPSGDPDTAFFLHADGAGTKSIVSYLLYRETNDTRWFRSLAFDSLIMNVDDVACAGALTGYVLSNTIGRNRHLVPDQAIQEIINGYSDAAALLAQEGIPVTLAGGETADMGDLVRTLVVDSTLCARAPRSALVDTTNVKGGDVIVGFSSTGKARFEDEPNSGMGSNGLTLARNTLLSRTHVERYPEIGDPGIPKDAAYRGPYEVTDKPAELEGRSVGSALLSPTRPYAPLIKALLASLGKGVHSLVHCTGGGQTKIKRFGRNVRFEKDNLFPVPPIFSLIQQHGQVPWDEMYAVFNMGHRLEACLEQSTASEAIAIAEQFGIAARVIGRVTSIEGDSDLVISSPYGQFVY